MLCVCTGCLVWCLCPELYTQPGFCILTIFPVSLQFFFVLILMPPKGKRSVKQQPSRNTRLRPPPIEFISDALPPATEAFTAPLPLTTEPHVPASTSATGTITLALPTIPATLVTQLASQVSLAITESLSSLLDPGSPSLNLPVSDTQVHLLEDLPHSSTLRAKIWSNKFFEFGLLLLQRGGRVQLLPQPVVYLYPLFVWNLLRRQSLYQTSKYRHLPSRCLLEFIQSSTHPKHPH